jgi:hypothetical protein
MTAQHILTCDEVRDLAPMFATDALDADEMAAVRAHLADCPDAHDEVLAFGEAATTLLQTIQPVEPPPALKSRLLAAAAADLASGAHPASRAVPPVDVGELPTPALAPPAVAPPIDLAAERARRPSRLGWLVAVAAVIGVIALGAWNITLQRDLGAAQAYRQGVDQALALATQQGSVTAILASEDGSSSGLAVIGADGTTRITVRGLAPTSGSQVYTAWAIEGEAAPVAIGDLTVGADGLATATVTSPTSDPGAVIALTLEPVPGATVAAGPLVVAGTTRDPAG